MIGVCVCACIHVGVAVVVGDSAVTVTDEANGDDVVVTVLCW